MSDTEQPTPSKGPESTDKTTSSSTKPANTVATTKSRSNQRTHEQDTNTAPKTAAVPRLITVGPHRSKARKKKRRPAPSPKTDDADSVPHQRGRPQTATSRRNTSIREAKLHTNSQSSPQLVATSSQKQKRNVESVKERLVRRNLT